MGFGPLLPLDEAYKFLRQRVQPHVVPEELAAAQQDAEVQHITSDFFRDVAAQLGDFSTTRDAQVEAYQKRSAPIQEEIATQSAAEEINREATAENMEKVQELEEQQRKLKQQQRQQMMEASIDNPVDASLVADATVEGEDEGGGGFLSGLRDIAAGVVDVARGATDIGGGAATDFIGVPFEVARELLTGDLEGARGELGEGVASIREPFEAALEITREAIQGDLAGLRRELAEAGREVPQVEDLTRVWDGLNRVMLGEQKIVVPLTRPLIGETLKAFQVPDGIADTIAKYAAEVLVPSTFIPIYGQVGKTKGAAQLLKVAMAEGSINVLQNRAGRRERGEGETTMFEDLTMFTFGAAGRLGLEGAAKALSTFMSRGGGRAATKALSEGVSEAVEEVAKPAARKLAPDEVMVYHGSGGKIPGETLEEGTFVTTDRVSAQKYAEVDGRVRKVRGQKSEPVVYETVIKRELLNEVPEDATTLGNPFVLRQAAQVTESVSDAAPVPVSRAVPEPEVKPKPEAVPEPEAPKSQVFDPDKPIIDSNSFDGVPRQRVQHYPNRTIYLRGDGTYDVFHDPWANPTIGITSGMKKEQVIRNFPTLDEAKIAAADQSKRLDKFGSESVGVRLGEEALEEAQTPRIVREAADIAEDTQARPPASRFQKLVSNTRQNGGATVDPKTGNAIPLSDKGYVVGGGVPTKTIPAAEFTEDIADDFVRQHQKVFDQDGVHLGTEQVGKPGQEVVNLDASIPVKNRDEAIRLAQERGEKRIYDVAADESFDTPIRAGDEVPVSRVTGAVDDEEAQRMLSTLEDWTDADKASVRVFVGVKKSTVGSAPHSWVSKSRATLVRVIEALKKLGRKLHTSELGSLRVGRRPDVSGVKYPDVLNIGAARRWLHPEESWQDWSAFMARRVGGKEDYWMSTARKDIHEYVEHNMGLIGEGPVGGGVRINEKVSDRFGPPTHPRTYQEMVEIVDKGSHLLNDTGRHLDMRKWYDDFHKFMKNTFGEDADVVTMLAATTQVNQSPASGVPGALRAFINWKLGEPIAGQSSSAIRKGMEAVIRGGVPQGPKVNPFWEALWFQGKRGRNAVAIDRWMFAAIGAQQGKWKNLSGNRQFIRLAQTIVREAADEAGISPRAFQAALWGGTKKEWNAIRGLTGQKGLGEDFSFFHDLFKQKMEAHGLRAPKDFKRMSAQAELFDVETLERQAADALGLVKPGETAMQRSQRLNDLLYSEWNEKVASATLLETGEIPAAITSQAARDRIIQRTSFYRRQFEDRVVAATTETLELMSKKGRLPSWQRKIIEDTIESNKARLNAASERMKSLPLAEHQRLNALGWDHVPLDPNDLRRVQTELADLDGITTTGALTRWLKRNESITGPWQRWVGKSLPTGQTYVSEATGQVFERHVMAPYWESRSFYETSRKLNIQRVKNAIRSRYPDQRIIDGTAQPIGNAMKTRKFSPLGPCA